MDKTKGHNPENPCINARIVNFVFETAWEREKRIDTQRDE